MGVVVLWMCFLFVLVATALAVCVIVRDGRLYLAARRAGATRMEAVAQVPASRKARQPGTGGRRLGQLMPFVEQEVPTTRPRSVHVQPRGRGLGQLLPDVQPTKAESSRGLGRLSV